jgi:hypothetical protein
VIWKTIAGKPIGEELVRELIERGRTRELPGFRSRAGKQFRAMLALDPQAEPPVTLEFMSRPAASAPDDPDARGRTGA